MKKSIFVTLIILISSVILVSFAEWSPIPPDAIFITKQQYRSRIRETIESTDTEKEGWLFFHAKYGDWSDWISNGTTFISSDENREVQTVLHAAETTITGYSYRRYKYYNTSEGKTFYTYVETWANAQGYSGSWEYKTTTSKLNLYNVYDGVQSYGKRGDFWFYETPKTTVVNPEYTEYKYRTRNKSYILFRWLEWSDWGDAPITQTDNIEVETRTMYLTDDQFLHSTIVVGRVPEVTLLSGTGCQLRYGNNPTDLQWSSTMPEIAAVSQNGYLSAYKAGQTIVTVENASIIVNVKECTDIIIPKSVTMIETSAFEGGNYTSVSAGSITKMDDHAFSNNEKLQLVVVDRIGSVSPTAFSGSSHAIIASREKQNNLPIPYYVSGKALPFVYVNSISLSHNTLTLTSGSSQLLTSTILPANASSRTITWSTSNSAIVSVSNTGTLEAKSPGSATITAKAIDGSGISTTCNVTVIPRVITGDQNFTLVTADGITQTDATVRFKINLSGKPTCGGFYFGTSSSNLSLIKSESYTAISEVKEVWFNLNKYWGKLSPNTTYYYKLYYVYNEIIYESAVHTLKTLANPTISSSISNFEIGENESTQLSCTVYPDNALVSWTSSNTDIATVSSNGVVFGLKGGSVSITATVTYGAVSVSHVFYVYVNPITYRLVLDINFQYKKEQLYDAYDLNELDFYEFCMEHPFLGLITHPLDFHMEQWHPSQAKIYDGGGIVQLYRDYLVSRGQKKTDALYISDVGKSTVLASIRSVFCASDDNDVNIFFYGGHGASDGSLFLQTGDKISPSELLGAFNGVKGYNVLLISSCYSGAVAKAMRSHSNIKGAVLAACRADELSYSSTSGSKEYSNDVYYFLRGLGYDEISESKLSHMYADGNDDGKVFVGEIISYMQSHVNKTQTFTYYCTDGKVLIYSR